MKWIKATMFLAAATACASCNNSKLDTKAALDLLVERYGPCFAAPGFPQADEATVRKSAVVRTARATDDGWVPVTVLLENSATGHKSESTFRINVKEDKTTPQAGDTDALAVLAKCP